MTPRMATAGDLDAVVALERQIFPDDAWPRDKLEDDLRSSFAHFLVTESGGVITGYAIAQHLPGNDVADIQNIAVVEAHQGEGLGAALLDALLSWCESRHATAIMLEVRADNGAAQSLYASRGFHTIATRPGYYQPAGVDAFVMRREVTS
ncbi:MAG: ribosomal protein S18-alanine N-acetyltransferase [Microbacteriaceae bacterium]|nr:ribosomal protein S18-alanine N-acetyltransferase [Microbacteriaceae bacterium]